MSFQSRMSLLLISSMEISMSAHSYKVFEFLCCSFCLVLNRNKDSVILRLKIDKKCPALALENWISAQALIQAFTVCEIV